MCRFLRTKVCLIALLLSSYSSISYAGLLIDNGLFYNFGVVGDIESSSRLFDSLSVGSTFGKGYLIGWNVSYFIKSSQLNGQSTALQGYEMGPKFGKFINKSESLSVAIILNPLVHSTATLVDGSVESWSGFGAQGEVAFAQQVSRHTWFGVKVIFDYIVYNQKTNSSNTTSSMSYSFPSVLPTLYLSWRFN